MSSAFTEKAGPPDDDALGAVLGAARKHWEALLAHVDGSHADLRREWKFYGAKYGWQLKVLDRKKAVLYLIPHERSFMAALPLGPRAVEELASTPLPPALVEEIRGAKASPEGQPARVEVRTAAQATQVKQLLDLARRTTRRA
jgi:hypothetical protein